MRLEQAAEILLQELEFLIDNTLDPDTAVTIVSGGKWPNEKDPLPALYANHDLAVEAWMNSFKSHIGHISEHDTLYIRWIEKPIMDRYQITVQDTKDMHRLVNDRFSVYSKFAMVRRTKQVKPKK